jgi:hypothetical protein
MISNTIIFLVLAAIFTESLTELVVKSNIFKGPRRLISSLGSFLGDMLSCGYCFSAWAAMAPATLSVVVCGSNGIASSAVQWVAVWLIVHRLSNYTHNINDKFFDKNYSNNHSNEDEE